MLDKVDPFDRRPGAMSNSPAVQQRLLCYAIIYEVLPECYVLFLAEFFYVSHVLLKFEVGVNLRTLGGCNVSVVTQWLKVHIGIGQIILPFTYITFDHMHHARFPSSINGLNLIL